MKLIVNSTSRHPHNAVNWLVKFAAEYVRTVAAREGWLDKLEAYPVQVTVTNSQHAYCGRSLGVRRFPKDRRNIYGGSEARRCFLVRVGAASRFPTNSTYPRYTEMPEATLNDWQEAVVGLTAHELTHTHYNYATGDRKGDEFNCEMVEIDCVDLFRRSGRALFDAAMATERQRDDERLARQAAKQAPEAVAAQRLADGQEKLARWQRKLKLATTKVKHYTRVVKRRLAATVAALLCAATANAVQPQEVVAAVLIAEAGGQGAVAMRAVREVIQMRAFERHQTEHAVVSAPKQFSCLNRIAPARLVSLAKRHPLWPDAVRLAAAPVRQATVWQANHYHALTVRPAWSVGARPVAVVGGHAFYKL